MKAIFLTKWLRAKSSGAIWNVERGASGHIQNWVRTHVVLSLLFDAKLLIHVFCPFPPVVYLSVFFCLVLASVVTCHSTLPPRRDHRMRLPDAPLHRGFGVAVMVERHPKRPPKRRSRRSFHSDGARTNRGCGTMRSDPVSAHTQVVCRVVWLSVPSASLIVEVSPGLNGRIKMHSIQSVECITSLLLIVHMCVRVPFSISPSIPPPPPSPPHTKRTNPQIHPQMHQHTNPKHANPKHTDTQAHTPLLVHCHLTDQCPTARRAVNQNRARPWVCGGGGDYPWTCPRVDVLGWLSPYGWGCNG